MNKKVFLMLAAAAATMTVSCNKNLPQPEPKAIAIDPLITRATETDFEAGDKVGLTITRGEEVFAQNYQMTYDGSQFKSDLLWYTEGEQTSKFVAYFPYAANVPTTFEVAADQSGAQHSASDLMAAVKEEVTPQAAVTMVFKHLLTRIVVNIDNQVGATVSSVKLMNSIPSATVDLEGMNVAVKQGEEAADIIMHQVSENTRYAAIVVPQTVKFRISIEVEGGRTITKSLSEVILKAGGQYSINAVIMAGDVAVSLSGDIENWSDEGVIPEKEITFHEYENYFEYDGVNYNTVVLADGNKWMAENMRYIPDGKVVSATPGDGAGVWYPYTVDGEGNCTADKSAAAIAADGYLYDYNTILGTKITESNYGSLEGSRGICPPGWHVPTRAEYFALCGNSNASAFEGESSGTKTNPDAAYYVEKYSAATVGKFNEAGFNFPLCGCISLNAYNKLLIDENVCTVADYYGKKRMTYLATSSPNKPDAFFGVMTTFTSVNSEGKVSLSFATLAKAAVVLRCVKNKENQNK